jgi:CheY-like chemotaxis protein
MHWRLLQQTARAMGLPLDRVIEPGVTTLVLEFPHTVNESMLGASAVEIDEGFATSMNTKPLAGSHVLVVARRRDVRVQVREALRDMGLIVDFVSSIEEAVDFCRDGLPHAIVVESVLCGDRFSELRQDIAAEVPEFVFIEIIEDSQAFEMSGVSPVGMARVGRDVMAQSLPSALLFELARGG